MPSARQHLALRRLAHCALAAGFACLTGVSWARGATLACPALYPNGTVPFTGLDPQIESKPNPQRFAAGTVVEIDLDTMSNADARDVIARLQERGARVSIYLAGGHCVFGRTKDCESLKGVALGTTGSWNWDKDEKRILDITHPAVVGRIRDGARAGWQAGANYIRVDNLHHPAGSQSPRNAAQMAKLFTAIHDTEDELRASGIIPPDRPTGVVAHNNLEVWGAMIAAGTLRRPPVFLTSERTVQLAFKGEGYKGDGLVKRGALHATDVGEVLVGGRIAMALGIPYTIAEFAISHDLGGKPGATYKLPASYVTELAAVPGVSEVIVIPSESNYVGRGTVHHGGGPRTLAAAPWPDGSGIAAAACLKAGAGEGK